MEITILNTTERPLLRRTEVTGRIFFSGATPSTAQVRSALAQQLGCAEERLVIEHIHTAFGSSSAHVLCHCYERVEDLRRIAAAHEQRQNAVAASAEPEPATGEEPAAQAAEQEE